MKVKFVFSSFSIAFLFLTVFVYAQTLNQPEIESPDSGSSFTQGTTFTLTAEVSCSGPPNAVCNNVQLQVNLPSGLTTSSNSQSCGNVNRGSSCSKSWTINADTVGTYSITVTASSTNADTKTSGAISITVSTLPPPPAPTPLPPPPAAPTISLEILSPTPNQTLIRGEKINIKARSLAGASVNAEIFSKTIVLHDDGLHDDEKTNDAVYAGSIDVKSFHEGSYKIIISTDAAGYTGAAVSRDIFVNPLLNILAPFNKTEYFKGEKMILTGDVRDYLNRTIVGGNLNIDFSFKQWGSSGNTQIGVGGNFLLDYPISFGDPEGVWNAKISAKDQFNNSGSTKLTIDVKTPPAGSFLYVKFLTPVEGLTYSRGETLKLAVEVTEAEKPVSNANVSIKTPVGEIIKLDETTPGNYIAEYGLGYDAPVGDVSIVAEGIKVDEGKFKGGGNFIPIAVKPVNLKVDLVSPTKSEFVAGQTVKIQAKAFYPDGTTVGNAGVFVDSPTGKRIFLKEEEKGLYTADYLIQTGDEGSWQMQLNVVDAYENSGVIQKVIFIGQITLFYLLVKYWYFVLLGISPFVYLWYRFTQSLSEGNRLADMNKELKRVIQMKKEAQIKYYKKGSIDKPTYDSLMKEYEEKEEDLKTNISKLKRREK